jgi:hypothetical protein
VKPTDIKFSESVKGAQFSVQGRGCKTLHVALLHITAQDSSALTEYTFTGMPETFEGNLWLIAQSGEAFGKKNQKSYTLGESIPAATKTQTSAGPAIFEGPYTVESERADTSASLSASREHVILARCMSKRTDGHSFGPGELAYLKKHAAETQDEIIAVTIRWEK